MTDLPNLPLIRERFWNIMRGEPEYSGMRYPNNFEFYMFPQSWGDTSCMFSGWGGQAITTAYTTVVIDNVTGWAGVFCNERFAYAILNPNDKFFDDLRNGKMSRQTHRFSYIKENSNSRCI